MFQIQWRRGPVRPRRQTSIRAFGIRTDQSSPYEDQHPPRYFSVSAAWGGDTHCNVHAKGLRLPLRLMGFGWMLAGFNSRRRQTLPPSGAQMATQTQTQTQILELHCTVPIMLDRAPMRDCLLARLHHPKGHRLSFSSRHSACLF